MALKENTLSSVVEISRQFLRSIQIDDDFGREDALSGYVCQGTAQSLLESMAQQLLETKQRAFTWTGVELQRKVSHYLQPILSHRFLNNLA